MKNKIEKNGNTILFSDSEIELDENSMLEDESAVPEETKSIKNYTKSDCVFTNYFGEDLEKNKSMGILENYKAFRMNDKKHYVVITWMTFDNLTKYIENRNKILKWTLCFCKGIEVTIFSPTKKQFHLLGYEIMECSGPLYKIKIKIAEQV